jgi:hypothetical protein
MEKIMELRKKIEPEIMLMTGFAVGFLFGFFGMLWAMMEPIK